MRSTPGPDEKPLFWVSSSKRDLLAMPEPVVRELGTALGYVLHCFQKKSPSGIRTARTDVDLITARLKLARADYEVRYGKTDQ